jgi:hypothetical protein
MSKPRARRWTDTQLMLYADKEYSLLGVKRTIRLRHDLNGSKKLRERIKVFAITRLALLGMFKN